MRNLEILTKSIDTLKLLQENEKVICSCIDEFSKVLFVYTSLTRLLIYNYSDNISAHTTFNHAIVLADENPNLENALMIQIDYVQELQGVQFTYSSGNMYLYKLEEKKIEEVGEIPDGILAAAWAPNQEYLAVATSQSMLLFTLEFDVLYEQPIDDGDLTFASTDTLKQSIVKDAIISWRGDS
jgi:hypothetical protein